MLKLVRKIDKRARFVNDCILFKGQLYNKTNIHTIPGVNIQQASCVRGNGITLFSGSLCPLSNLYPVPFEVDGETYQSSEHFYQVKKCEDLGNVELSNKIQIAPTTRDAMFLGKSLQPDHNWLCTTGNAIMRRGVERKFAVEEMRDYLLSTNGIIGEATKNPHWGIGHNLNAEEGKNIANWTGSNALGDILTNLRDELIAK